MKKLTKSIVSLALVVVVLVCFCGTALAVEDIWTNFPNQVYGVFTSHAYGAQAFLFRYSTGTRRDLTNNDTTAGVDGQYYNGSREATITFQRNTAIGVDGEVGPETWGKMWELLTPSFISGNRTYYKVNTQMGLNEYYAVSRYVRYASNIQVRSWYAYNDDDDVIQFV